MPVLTRLRLRQQLGQAKLRDTIVGTTTLSLGVGSAAAVLNQQYADTSLTGQGIGQGFYLRLVGQDFRVASFNVASGAYVSAQTMATTIGGSFQFEIHKKLSAAEKDRALDGVIQHLWQRQEIPIDTVGGLLQYSIGQGFKVFGAYYFANPTATLDRDVRDLPIGWQIAMTGSGRELRLPFGAALSASQQLVIDAQVRATLGAADTATVNIPDEDWVLNGAAARAYQALWSDAPGKEAGRYKELAVAFGTEFRKQVGKYRDRVEGDWRGAFDGPVF